jgi:hypothetical protein
MGIMSPLPEWQNFYVIVGSSAGALIGLHVFVRGREQRETEHADKRKE